MIKRPGFLPDSLSIEVSRLDHELDHTPDSRLVTRHHAPPDSRLEIRALSRGRRSGGGPAAPRVMFIAARRTVSLFLCSENLNKTLKVQ